MSVSLAKFTSAVHAYDVMDALTYVKDLIVGRGVGLVLVLHELNSVPCEPRRFGLATLGDGSSPRPCDFFKSDELSYD